MQQTKQPADTAHVGKSSDFKLHCKAAMALKVPTGHTVPALPPLHLFQQMVNFLYSHLH